MKVHALTKMMFVICITSCSLIYQNVSILLELLLLSIVLNLLNSNETKEWKQLFKYVYKLLPIFLSIFIIQILFSKSGVVFFKLGFIKMTSNGLNVAFAVILRLLIIVFSAGYLLKLGLRDYLTAFKLIRLPESFAVVTALTIGFIPLVSSQINRTLVQIKLRGIVIRELTFSMRIKLYLSLIMPIIGKSLSKAGFQAITLELRGFRNGSKHSNYMKVRLRGFDYICIFTALFLLVWSVV